MTKPHGMMVLGLTLGLMAAGTGMEAYPPPAPDKQTEQRARTDRYGDPLPQGAIARLGTVRLRQVIRLSGVDPAPSPDGKTLATLGDGGIRLWSMESGQLLWQADNFHFLKFSPNGKLLATGGVSDPELPPAQQRQAICFLDTATGRVRHRLRTYGRVIAFSSDGKQVVVNRRDDANTVSLWDIETGRRIFQTKEHKDTVKNNFRDSFLPHRLP